MRRSAAVIFALCVIVSIAPASAATETVTGQLVDLACRALDEGNAGNAHKGRGYNCAQACAMEGFAVGLLTADGKVYQVTGKLAENKNAMLVPHMASTVRVTGDVGAKNGQMSIAASALDVVKN